MNSDILSNQNIRNDGFKKNPKLDELIAQLRQVLEPAEAQLIQKYTVPHLPVVLVVGNSRSGSTLLTQILAAGGDFSYPTNALNRLAYAPALGAMIQQMLFNKEYAYLNELTDIQTPSGFNSQLGKTDGAMGVSEFYHFWRRFIPNYDLEYLDSKELAKIDIHGLRRELAALVSIFGKPFICKGKAIQYNIATFSKQIPELFFIHIEREPLYVMQSILLGRRKFYQSEDIWFGVKPPEYQDLKNMDIYHQIAGQVLFTDRIIHAQLEVLDPNRSVHCRYEDLCANPSSFYDNLASALLSHNFNLTSYHLEEVSFPSSNVQKLDNQELLKLQAAYDKLKAFYNR